MQETIRYFLCRTNPTAPLLVLNTNWESDEMRSNPDYDEVDAEGLPVVLAEIEPREAA